ncbi:hypothetical protein DC366_03400 [Pelagivirga sediminicola]|uniref:DUF2484 domain-containing protein n=1 Tax=Pelagivirga sediminicola TaxID=2170575 RepID=A0A2T7GC37_9RHOB|nr:DUF2484 family protein [Pelagivirga sediminicola]PVA11977.1 hypothetical protein DC366_03400 [Pelagivirga sediminicola]
MPTSLILACLWALAANLLAMTPSRDNHWRAAYALIAVGIPILGYVTWQNGPWIGLFCLVAAASMLRWPVVYLWRWLRGAPDGLTED